MCQRKQLILAAAVFAASILVDGALAEDCSGYTFSNCHPDYSGVIVTMHCDDQETCQKACNEVYPHDCNAFFYNRADNSCLLLRQTVSDHVKTCDQIGGTKTPEVEYCLSQSDPCSVFHEESCTNTSNVIAYIQNVPSAAVCQEACKLQSNCSYFLYDINVSLCQLLDGVRRECAHAVGPARPSYEECETRPPVPSQCTTPVYKKSDGQCACGFYLEDKLSWYGARATCVANGARLPEVYSEEDNTDIFNLKPQKANFWLGATDEGSEGTFVWQSTSQPVSYTFWTAGEPNGGKNENCLAMVAWLAADVDIGQWNDDPCTTQTAPSLCEVVFPCY